VEKFGYMAMLAFTVCGSFWLEIVLKTGVLRRWKRALISILPISTLFLIWDAYAIAQGHWTFDPRYVTGITTVADIPLDEILFFIVIPICAILSFEAVRSARNWEAGDEEPK
jgi:lycopene cyclase domain-containing protein